MSRFLDVYLHDVKAGQLEQTDTGDLAFAYDPAYIDAEQSPISISLPLNSGITSGANVRAFYSGLLPDETVRERLAASLGITPRNPFALLEAVGGDCAGALSLFPVGERPDDQAAEEQVLDDAQLKDVLKLLRQRPMLAGEDGYRLSLAGAQDKLAVSYKDARISLIKGGAPTTHILKPVIEGVQDSAHNELFCMRLAKAVGLDAPKATVYRVDDELFYLVERYDRKVNDKGEIRRIHQEDFCQALGIVPELKYEREGGPSVSQSIQLIADNAARPAVDQFKFLDLLVFNFLIGNADAHGKNFSFLYKNKKPDLAPAYDLMSTAVYPELSSRMAMKIGGKYKPEEVALVRFHKHLADTKAARNAFNRRVQTLLGKIAEAAKDVGQQLANENLDSEVYAAIIRVIQKRSQKLSLP